MDRYGSGAYYKRPLIAMTDDPSTAAAAKSYSEAIMKSTALVLSLLLPYVAQTQTVVQTLPVVDLGYSMYQGITQNGINKWLGIRFAAPPTGNFRWRAPALPLGTTGVQLATTVSLPSPIDLIVKCDLFCVTRLDLRVSVSVALPLEKAKTASLLTFTLR
jgi:hypothetical protein